MQSAQFKRSTDGASSVSMKMTMKITIVNVMIMILIIINPKQPSQNGMVLMMDNLFAYEIPVP